MLEMTRLQHEFQEEDDKLELDETIEDLKKMADEFSEAMEREKQKDP